MTRRMLAAISVLALATVAPLALFPGSATAQDPDYILSLTDANGPPGGIIDVQVMFDNTGDDVAGWSFGVAHDPAFATLIDLVDGITTATSNNGGPPNFNQVNFFPDTGFTVGVVICFTGCAVLPGGSLNNELNIATYQLNSTGTPGSSSQVEFVDTIGSPAVEILLVVNGVSVLPTTEDGTLSFIACSDTPAPPTNLTCIIETDSSCQCQALLEWQAPPSLNYFFEIYVDGFLATSVPWNTTSAIITLPSSDPVEICIRSSCPDLFSPFVCCTVECDLDLDCNNNGVLDDCEIAQGSPDCNQNGILDFCEYSIENDCNLNSILDECELNTDSDSNADGILDSCQEFFIRGDCNTIGTIDIADAIFLLGYLFSGFDPSSCEDACDVNDDSDIDIGDGIYILTSLFIGGDMPPPPFPTCGVDPTEDLLGCENFGVCP